MVFRTVPTPRQNPGKSGFEFDVPVNLADELRPTVDTDSDRCVNRLPFWLNRFPFQRHVGLSRRAVGFAGIAINTRHDAILPRCVSTVRPRHDVIDRQLLAARPSRTILTRKLVPFKHISTAERHRPIRNTVVLRQCDHFRNSQTQTTRLNIRLVVDRLLQRPIRPRIDLVIIGIDNAGRAVPKLDESA